MNNSNQYSVPQRQISNRLINRVCSILLCTMLFSACATAVEPSLEEQVDGLWLYTGLTTKDGTEMPLTGVFLFKDGIFLQQAVFDSEPFESAGSMSHTGPTRAEPATGSVHLTATQQISTAPGESPALSFKDSTEHDVTVTREGDVLTLIFGMGTSTVQTFQKVGPGEGELYALSNGSLALVDGYFVLVAGDASSAITGYGTYTQDGEDLTLNVIRWSEADATGAKNLKDVSLQATFNGVALTLEDGRSFEVMN